MKKTKLVLDTNILIYALNEDSEFFQKTREVLEDNEYSFFITTKTVTEFVSVLSKLGEQQIIDNELPKVLNRFKILYPNKKSLQFFQDLVKNYQPKGNRVFDFEIVSVMMARKINKLFTFNGKDFKQINEIELISIE